MHHAARITWPVTKSISSRAKGHPCLTCANLSAKVLYITTGITRVHWYTVCHWLDDNAAADGAEPLHTADVARLRLRWHGDWLRLLPCAASLG